MRRVLHLAGSAVSEFFADLSRLYARDCLAATADPERYAFHVAYVTPDRRWRFPVDLSEPAIAAAPPMALPAAIERIVAMAPDVVVPQMFCLPGMTSYRALLDVLGLPYVGNPPHVMAIGADKPTAKAIVAAAGVAVPDGVLVRAGERPALPGLPVPAVVKPADADNSSGVTLVRDPGAYPAALAAALEHSAAALVETYVELGREVRCGLLERDGELTVLPLEEYRMDPVAKPVRGADDKLARAAGGDLRLVAKDPSRAWIVDPDDPLTARVGEAAIRCHRALGCRHYSLFDFRVDPDGEPWFLEAGLYNSFARQSVVAMMAAAAGTDLPTLFAAMLDEATAR